MGVRKVHTTTCTSLLTLLFSSSLQQNIGPSHQGRRVKIVRVEPGKQIGLGVLTIIDTDFVGYTIINFNVIYGTTGFLDVISLITFLVRSTLVIVMTHCLVLAPPGPYR